MSGPVCPVCGGATSEAGQKVSARAARTFLLRHCESCRFTFIANPWTDYAKIYNEDYYFGKGADPLVDYVGEMEHPKDSIRTYEWRGILAAVSSLKPVSAQTKWIDYGCGNGMLLKYVREQTHANALGFEEGWIAEEARKSGIEVLKPDELAAHAGTCDVVTAIEVLEHVADPLETLRSIRKLLKPGGLFFYTTGNAQPHRGRVANWPYCIPEIHISFYEPKTLEYALNATGFKAEFAGYRPGFTDIIRFKALKNLGARERSVLERVMPWGLLSRMLDARLKILRHPVGWAV